MTRIGLTLDQLAASADQRPARYAARTPGLNLLAGETVALVGDGTAGLLERLATALPGCGWVDGREAARGGTLRIHALHAARVGVQALAVTGPFDRPPDLAPAAGALMVADIAGLVDLGLTVVVEVADPGRAARFADRVVVVEAGRPVAAYPVLQPRPRDARDVGHVVDRVSARLAGRAMAAAG